MVERRDRARRHRLEHATSRGVRAARHPGAGDVIVVAEAPNAVEAAIWVDALVDAGIDARSFERSHGAALGGAATLLSRYPVLVPRSALVPARNLLAELAGASVLAPYREAADRSRLDVRLLLVAAAALAAVVAARAAMDLMG